MNKEMINELAELLQDNPDYDKGLEQQLAYRKERQARVYRGEVQDTAVEDCRPNLGWGGIWGF